MNNLEKEIEILKRDEPIGIDLSFEIAKKISVVLRSNDSDEVQAARHAVIHVLDKWSNLPTETHQLWADIVEACGFYPYLEKEAGADFVGTAGKIRKELNRSDFLKGKYFHDAQAEALRLFNSGVNLVVSAPTSFGKSLLIEELIAGGSFDNIIIIQPTLALLDETRRNLKKYADLYKIVIKTTQEYSKEKKNIFLFTAERVIEYSEFPKIDLLIIDEFYKLSAYRKDERADALNVAFYKILKEHNPRFYLLGPNIDSVSPKFTERYNAKFYKTSYSLVAADVISLYDIHKIKLSQPTKNKAFIEELLFATLMNLRTEQTLIYCSSPEKAREIAGKFLRYLKNVDNGLHVQTSPLIEWIKEYVHPDWSLCEELQYGIGVHDGALPRHLSSSIIHQFNRQKIKYLFCTSTIIEGVNTSAKNVILFHKKKGTKAIDYFDYSNIKGRAGRLMVHYVGRVFNFHPDPKPEIIDIDLPFFDQHENTTEEIFIQIEKKDISNPDAENYQAIEGLAADEREVFKQNGVSVFGQKKILEQLIRDLKTNRDQVIWTGYPKWEQLLYAINLASKYLKKPSESMGFSPRKVAFLMKEYASKKEIMSLVSQEFAYALGHNKKNLNKEALLDNSIRTIFQFQRHWLGYTLPKWFHVLNNLQEFACKKMGIASGDYKYYASIIENDFLNPGLTFLIEMGLPRSAVQKISRFVGDETEDEEEMLRYVNSNQNKMGFTEYEIERLSEL